MRFADLLPRHQVALVTILACTLLGPRSEALSNGGELAQPIAAQEGDAPPSTVLTVLRRAIVTADVAQEKDSLLMAVAATLARAGHADEALRLADGDHPDQFKRSICRATAFGQARSGDFVGASRTARLLGASGFRELAPVIAALRAWAGDIPGAKRMIEAELADSPESGFAFRMRAMGLEEKGDYAGASQLYEAIPSPWEKARGRRPAASARLAEGDIAGALRAAQESRHLARIYLGQRPPHRGQAASSMPPEIEPDWFSDSILAKVVLEQARRGDAPGAKRTAEMITQTYSRALTAANAAAILARAGDRASAKEGIKRAFELAELAGYRGFELMEIATAEARSGEIQAARKTFIRALGTVGPAVMNQSLIPAAQAEAGDLEGALQTLGAIGDPGARQRALRYIARNLAKTGDVRRAAEIASGLPSANERILSLREVSEAQAAAGDRVGAQATVRGAARIDGALDKEDLRSLARALAHLGDAREATAWVDERSTPVTRAWGLLGVAEGLLPRAEGPNLQLENP